LRGVGETATRHATALLGLPVGDGYRRLYRVSTIPLPEGCVARWVLRDVMELSAKLSKTMIEEARPLRDSGAQKATPATTLL
jgi:hypothetical protein